MDIFHAPSEVFARRRGAGFWRPLLVVAGLASILTFSTSRILAPAADADSQRQVRAMQQANPELDVSGSRRILEASGDFFALAGGVFLAIAVFVQGLLIWAGGKLAGSPINGRSAVLIATYATVPTLLIGGLVAIVEGMLRGPTSFDSLARLSWGPARFMDPDANWALVKFIAGELDLFTIWWAVLVAIGLSIIGNVPRARAAAVVAAIFLATAIPGLIGLVTS